MLEAALPGLEVNNYAISGTATDQQYLTWQEQARTQHDLVIIGVYVENIRRITRRIVKGRDAEGAEVFRAKPYYELVHDRLLLSNVPVPRESWTEESLPDELRRYVYSFGEANFFFRNHSLKHEMVMRALAPLGPLRQAVKQVVTRFRKFQPLPDYDNSDNAGWQLMRRILSLWISESRVPVLLVTLPHESGLSGLSDPRSYQKRFTELAAETGCRLFDPLPELTRMPRSELRSLWSDAYGHLSIEGHAAIARLLSPIVADLMRDDH